MWSWGGTVVRAGFSLRTARERFETCGALVLVRQVEGGAEQGSFRGEDLFGDSGLISFCRIRSVSDRH